jgi:SnoaL-like domain
MQTTLNLPDPIAAYFAADRRGADAVVRCFTTQAVVKDEGRTHTGLDAIRAWKAAAATAYSYTIVPMALEQSDGHHVVTGRVSGNFPGSPIDLRYRFRLERGLIDSLEITA